MIRRLQPTVDVDQICLDGREIDEAVERAGREVRLPHKQMGVAIVVWQDGQVVEIPPEEIIVDLPQANSPPANPS